MKTFTQILALGLLFCFTAFSANAFNTDPIYKVVDEKAYVKTCKDVRKSEREYCSNTAIINEIVEVISYPKEAKDKGIEGKVYIRFVIGKDGHARDYELMKGLPYGLSEEAMSAVTKATQKLTWVPAQVDEQDVNMMMVLPVVFKLEGDSEEEAKVSEETPAQTSEPVYKEIDQKAYVSSCATVEEHLRESCSNDYLIEKIFETVEYPKVAKENKTEGTAYIQFVINRSGQAVDFKRVNELPDGLSDAAFKAVQEVAQNTTWVPAQVNDREVSMLMTLPIKFRAD